MKVLFFVADGTEDSEYITTRDMLKRAGIDTVTISVDKIDVLLSHGIIVKADFVIESNDIDYNDFDGVILPGGKKGVSSLIENAKVLKVTKEYYDNKKMVSAICAAPTILSKLGILDNKDFTCYEGFEKDIKGNYLRDKGVVKMNNVITGRSVYYSIDFALEIIDYLLGSKAKLNVMKGILMV